LWYGWPGLLSSKSTYTLIDLSSRHLLTKLKNDQPLRILIHSVQQQTLTADRLMEDKSPEKETIWRGFRLRFRQNNKKGYQRNHEAVV